MTVDLFRREVLGGVMRAGMLIALLPWTTPAYATRETAKVLYGFAPGGPVDALSRRIADQLGRSYAKSAVVEYRSGVGGRLAADALVAAPPDGSVMMHGPVGIFTFRPHIEKLSFDPLNDVVPVALTCDFASALAVGPMVPPSVGSLADFLRWCQANPKDASFGTPGVGTPMHLVGAMLARRGPPMTHVPYRQGPVQDVAAGQVAAAIAVESTFLPFVREGKLRVLATSGLERSVAYPSAPTFLELGYKDLVVRDWWAVFVPARTPAETVRSLAEQVQRAVQDPATQELIISNGLRPAAAPAAELGALLKREYTHWADVIRSTGFTAAS